MAATGYWQELRRSYHYLLFDRDGEVNQTERVLALLLLLALAAVAVIVLYAFSLGLQWHGAGFRFLIWALLLALGGWLAGGLLGMLFGLPSVVEVRIADGQSTDGEGARSGGSLGYRESTNLEQIADWITKILIGLTLTQYNLWARAFEDSFVLASVQMLPYAVPSPTPAAIVVLAFVTNGFLAAYLVMRRYFIAEMVRGRNQARKFAAEKIAVARDQGLLQAVSVTASPISQAQRAQEIATIAVNLSPNASQDQAQDIAREVREAIEYPDDPWRGKFGDTNAAGGCRLDATVQALEGSKELFTVRLTLIADSNTQRIGQSATFYLHPTFGAEPKKVAFGQDGIAALELIAYGAFTVGVLLETGERLELNLAALPGVPDLFRLR